MLTSTDPSTQRRRLHELEQQASTEGFWEQQDNAASVNQEMSEITESIQLTARLQAQLEDVATAVELIDMEVRGCSTIFSSSHCQQLLSHVQKLLSSGKQSYEHS